MHKALIVRACCTLFPFAIGLSTAYACPLNYTSLKELTPGGHLCGCQATGRACFDGTGTPPSNLQSCNNTPVCPVSPPMTPHNGDSDRVTPSPTVAPSATAIHHEEPTPAVKPSPHSEEPRPTALPKITATRHAEETPHQTEPQPTKTPVPRPSSGDGSGNNDGNAPQACHLGWSDMFNDAVVNLSDDATDPTGLLELQLLQKAGTKISWSKYIPTVEASGADSELAAGIASLAVAPDTTDSIDTCFSMLSLGKTLIAKCKQGSTEEDRKMAKALSDQLIKLPRKFLDLDLIGDREMATARKLAKALLVACKRQ